MMQKRGQQTFSMSFGMIFSIFLIIAIISVAIFAITKFVGIGRCAKVGLFYDNIQDEIDRAWSSGSGTYLDEKFEISVDKGVEDVCFGDPAGISATDALTQELKPKFIDSPSGHNIFLDSSKEICSGLESKKITHVEFTPEFFCKSVDQEGNIEISLSKPEDELLVRIKPDASI